MVSAVLGASLPHHRAFVAGRDDRDGHIAVGAETIVDEFAHLAAALADERDHHAVEAFRAGDHAEKRGFSDAGSREDANSLPGADRHEEIDHPHARLDRGFDAGAPQGGRRGRFDR